jgi:hypothetical protein
VRVNATLSRNVAVNTDRMLTDFFELTGVRLSFSSLLDVVLAEFAGRKNRTSELSELVKKSVG